jgi:hypothetical protein
MTDFDVKWISHHRKAQCPPNPKYPDGIMVDCGERPACQVALPYPAPECGVWIVKCATCNTMIAVTAAGRPDDPKEVMVACQISKEARV